MSRRADQLPEYYAESEVLERIPVSRSYFRKLVREGRFVPRLKLGAKWFFEKDAVHRYLEEYTHEGTPDEERKSTRALMAEAKRRVQRRRA